MANKVSKKMIKIQHNGPIYAKGGVYGPITTPYMEDVGTIFRMLTSNIKVVEVLAGGKEVVLTPANFDKDNNVVEQKPATPVNNNQQQNQNKNNPPQNNNQNNNKNNYNNNKNQQNQPPKSETEHEDTKKTVEAADDLEKK